MHIDKDASVAVVVNRAWANLHGVKMFLHPHENPQGEIRGVDESHILFATDLDSADARGLWIQSTMDKKQQDSTVEAFRLLVPWSVDHGNCRTVLLGDASGSPKDRIHRRGRAGMSRARRGTPPREWRA